AAIDPLVPVEAEPSQVFVDPGLRADLVPIDVGVLDPEDESALATAGEQPVVESGPRVADVERAGRRRREPDADGSGVVPAVEVTHGSRLFQNPGFPAERRAWART